MGLSKLSKHYGLILTSMVGILFFVLAQKHYFDQLNYTFRIATALLNGELGITTSPSWLNEMVPIGNYYYSVFPLGAILSVMPFSWITKFGIVNECPVALVVALLAAGCVGFAFFYTYIRSDLAKTKRALLSLWLVLGTWFMTNLLFAGAPQIALGFAVLGQLGALYFSCVSQRPFLAGLFFALAFGNRTEILLLAPVFILFLMRPYLKKKQSFQYILYGLKQVKLFFIIPLALGILTLFYNEARFGSFVEFGYALIPGVLSEPWYKNGIFSLSAIPENAHQMLWQGWKSFPTSPYLVPTGFGGSIILASPFILLLIRPHGDKLRIFASMISILILTFVLWMHGNPGGWQFSYRYAMILLPWLLVLFVEFLPNRITYMEILLWTCSILINIYATYLFLWTDYVHP